VVALEGPGRNSEARSEEMELVERLVADQMRPPPASPAPKSVVHEDHGLVNIR
jgi:hypothetical protein